MINYITADFVRLGEISSEDLSDVVKLYPFRVLKSYAKLIDNPSIKKQVIPDKIELVDDQLEDPLNEHEHSPVEFIIHRYPDRVVFIVSDQCATFCRFCMRKRFVGKQNKITKEKIDKAIDYIKDNPKISDVLLSGGDPLMLISDSLEYILQKLRNIEHVEIIRVGSRVPVTYPERIDSDLVSMLSKYKPLYLNTHFNHPAEITKESTKACELLVSSGIILGNQTVLLKGVNDDSSTLKTLFKKLLTIGVKPYYLHQMDLIKGTAHFRTSVKTGLDILKDLRGHISGMAIPHYVIDLPGGKGKVPLVSTGYSFKDGVYTLESYDGAFVHYKDLD